MEPPRQFGDRSDFFPHHKLPSPYNFAVNQEEERQSKELLDGVVNPDETATYRYEEQASSNSSSSSNASPAPAPSRTGFYVFSDSRPSLYSSPPPDYPLRVSQNGARHSIYEAHYPQHDGATVPHCYSSSPSHAPPSIDPTYLYSHPSKVELAQREPVAPQPPIALLRPLTHALPKEYHQPTCPRYRPQAPCASQQRQSEGLETPTSNEGTSGNSNPRRTKTSYDQKTTYMLNTLFFETFGHGTKPSKRQRRRIERKTGISSRRLTYWFSNHKRRAKQELEAYKRLLKEGKIQSYDSFNKYRNNNEVFELGEDNMCGDSDGDVSSDEESTIMKSTKTVQAD